MQLLRKHSIGFFIGLISLMTTGGIARAAGNGGGGGQVKVLAVLDGSLRQINKDSSVTVEDSAFFNPANAGKFDSAYAVQDQVTLKINESSTLYLRTAFNVTVKVLIAYTDAKGDTASVVRSFTVGYDSAHAYNSRSSFVFAGAHKVTVTVLSDSSNVTTWDPTSVLLLENQLITSPVFHFSCSTTVSNITVNPSTDPAADELPVSWNVVQGADQYDLEWTWVDSSALADTSRFGASPYDPTRLFRNSSTRVSVTGTSYNIPLIYDNTGTLFIRVRPVQLGNGYAVTNAVWSSDASPAVMGQYSFRGHERPLNWQSNISYAEEGKRKVVLQYYDGSLRNRQTVTKDNTTNTTIVGETYYDYQGRPAIQVMPAPTLKTVIQYTAGFNVSYNAAEYSQSNYDTLPNPAMFCSIHADSMRSDSGASLYYSPKNPAASIGLNQFIPNAQDYPFTETEYIPDNTGRIKRQGGVGIYHQLGSGHETQYYYGTPDYRELDALFGTEVGDRTHYFKNMVRDANGQYSVSYVDMHGRTIATALAGNPSPGMGALSSYTRKKVTETLADSTSAYIDGQSMISQRSIVVPMTDTFYFNYNFTPDILNDLSCQQQSICYTCRYDLDITITDNCNNQLISSELYNNLQAGQAFAISKKNFSLTTLANSCTDSSMNLSFNLILPEGSYTITKKLTVDPDAYTFYRDSIYLRNNTCTTISQFISQQTALAQAANPQCSVTCTNCTTTDADDIRNAMLQDMSPPYGQYADTLKAANADLYSIFYIPKDDSADFIPLYKLPQIVYQDANGNPDSIYNQASGIMVEPNSLTPAQFVQNFRPSWAEALLPYHPEYCRLQVLQTNNSSLFYDRRMEAIDTYQQAVDSGFINPTNDPNFPIANSSNIDPFASLQLAALNSKLDNYETLKNPTTTLSMWGLACTMVACDSGASTCPAQFATNANTFQALCTGDQDMAWRYFREMYLGAKQAIFNKTLLATPAGCTPANNRAYTTVPSSAILFKDGHLPEFNDVNNALNESYLQSYSQVAGPTDASNKKQAIQDSLGNSYTTNAQAYVSQWFNELSACSLYSPSDINTIIIPALAGLCRQASDDNHPFGASTLPPGQFYSFGGVSCTSFLDIVNTYNQQHGIHPATTLDSLNCNAEVIVSPLPYGNQPVYTAKPVYTRPSDCECNLISGLYNDFTLSTYGDVSFSAFLARTQHITMADSDLTTLRTMCSATSATCKNLSTPINLPPVMQCNSGPACARCQLIDSLYGTYRLLYPTDTPSITSDADTLQAQKNVLFQNYMNNRLGFNLQTWQYLQFMDTCSVHNGDTATTISGSLPRSVATLFRSAPGANYGNLSRSPDGSYYISGNYLSSGTVFSTGSVFHLDSVGNVLWQRSYTNANTDDSATFFGLINATDDGGFMAVGAYSPLSDESHQYQVVFLRGDASGNTLWQKTVHFQGALGWGASGMVRTHDGGYAIASDWNAHQSPSALPINLVFKIDSLGNVLWAKGIYDSANCESHLNYITEINDTLFLTGAQSTNPSLANSRLGLLFKMDESSGALYNPVFLYDSAGADTSSRQINLQRVYSSATGYQVAVGAHTPLEISRMGVVDLDFSGNLVAYHQVGVPPANSSSVSDLSIGYVRASDSGWLVGQTTNSTPHIYWTKYNPDWSTAWSTASTLPGDQTVKSVSQNPDGSYTAVGLNGNGDSTYMLLRLTANGNGGCYEDSATAMAVSSPSYVMNINRIGLHDSTLGWTYYSDTLKSRLVAGSASQIVSCGSGYYINYNGPLLCGKSEPLLPPVAVNAVTSCTDSTFFGNAAGTALYNTYIDSLTGGFERNYLNLCLQGYKHESFTVTHSRSEYHYTLYYYDQAGNLLKTVPPAGVQENDDTTWINNVEAAKKAGTVLVPNHTLVTNYRYNTLNQMVAQNSPDGGTGYFWYDRLGRLTLSQNARQQPNSQYSYTQYDTLGRIIQVGQLVSSTGATDAMSRNDSTLRGWLAGASSSADQITVTTYDSGSYAIAPQLGQRNIRNRVSWAALYNTAADLNALSPAAATYYTYDILGNVDTLVQDFGSITSFGGIPNSMNTTNNRFKKITYDFDLVSGKMNKVTYQHGAVDAFYHTYLYDAENRITNVQSSTDSINWDNDAFYSYYAHGPLSRTVLGQQQVQGINYAYTLQGWLKAINPAPYTGGAFTLRPDSSGNVVANNTYNLLLNYFDGDFKPISTAAGPDSAVSTTLGSDYRPLYNGNISSMGVNIKGVGNPMLYNYQYDQLNRLIHMDAWNRTATPWSTIAKTTDFQENIGYDPNGNIQKYLRNGSTATSSTNMDNLNYSYISGTNKLDHITDSVSGYCTTCNDITTQSAGNYQYDSIGELTADQASGISHIAWTVYGKIDSMTKSGDTTIKFTYDAFGNRISKTVIHSGDVLTTWYVRDAKGNILSTYTYGDPSYNGKDLTQTELDVYGSSRLGIWKRNIDVSIRPPSDSIAMPLLGSGDSLIFTRGNKLFELTNHLGNVLSTISDKRVGVSSDDSTITYFNPDVVSANDYYPFGMLQPGRTFNQTGSGNYRYGFNGKENDNEVKGTGDQIDYGMRVYDPRVGRFMSVDPLTKQYPWYSPYQFAGNTPIQASDMDGAEPWLRQFVQSRAAAHKSIVAVSTSGTLESGFLVSVSSGMAVDPKGNVLLFTTYGGVASGKGMGGGISLVPGISATGNYTTYDADKVKSLDALLGEGGNGGYSAGLKEVLVAGISIENNAQGEDIGTTYQFGLGFSAAPIGANMSKTTTTGTILTGAEYDKVYTDKANAIDQSINERVEYNTRQRDAGGSWSTAPYQAQETSVVTNFIPVQGKKDTYEITYEYTLWVTPNRLVNTVGHDWWFKREYHTGVTVIKDKDGNYVSPNYSPPKLLGAVLNLPY